VTFGIHDFSAATVSLPYLHRVRGMFGTLLFSRVIPNNPSFLFPHRFSIVFQFSLAIWYHVFVLSPMRPPGRPVWALNGRPAKRGDPSRPLPYPPICLHPHTPPFPPLPLLPPFNTPSPPLLPPHLPPPSSPPCFILPPPASPLDPPLFPPSPRLN